ncbi:MAG TPA: hypothetical protein VFI37_01940 [Gaiellaceae bacterium]|jgi:hypothetical protein|nr:hypothetical protein [Gaiellaceae bacterium]
MRYLRLLLPVVLSALCLTACGGARNAITIPLQPRHASGVDGVARLAPAGSGSRLTIELDAGDAPQGTTAAVYRGECRLLPTRAVTPRIAVEGGAARLHVDRAPRRLGDHAVALKRNGNVLACGDVPAARPGAGS